MFLWEQRELIAIVVEISADNHFANRPKIARWNFDPHTSLDLDLDWLVFLTRAVLARAMWITR